MRLFLLLRLGTLDLCRAAQGLLSVLALLALLSAGTLGLGGKSDPDQAVLGLELLEGLGGVVDEGEAGGLAATELGAQAEDLDLLLLGLVQAGELLAQLGLGDVGTTGVEDVTMRFTISPIVPSFPLATWSEMARPRACTSFAALILPSALSFLYPLGSKVQSRCRCQFREKSVGA